MTLPSISLQHARHLHLAAQGLLRPPTKKAAFTDLLTAIRQMSLLQIDTINVVARSPYLVLFSRLGAYPMSWLEEALSRGNLFEYWAHEACFVPREDYALLRHRMLNPQALGWKYNAAWAEQYREELNAMLAFIASNGPVRAADFDAAPGHQSGWWAWKPHKRHLENLFSAGELMVSERRNFQRVYDLRQRVLPDWDDARDGLRDEDALHGMLSNSVRSLGIFRINWLADYYRLRQIKPLTWLQQQREEGRLILLHVEQLGEMWLDARLAPLLSTPPAATVTALLSPFDPVVWDRKRALALFNFDYRLECYTPTPKRQYGYFVLPLLHRGSLKGRVDAKMDRASGQFIIKGLWLEESVRVTQRLAKDVQSAINKMARWHGATCVEIHQLPTLLQAIWGRAHWAL